MCATVSSSECIMTETTRVSFWTLFRCFPLKAVTHFPLNVGFLSFLTPGYCSSINHFAPGSEVSSSHLLINTKSYRCLQSWITGLSSVPYNFLVIQCQYSLKLNRILPGTYLWVSRLLKAVPDPIVRRNLEHHHSVDVCWINLKVLVPLHTLRLHENVRRSCAQSVFILRIGRISERAAF